MFSRTEPVVLPNLGSAPGYRRVADVIEQEIVSGRIKPGDLLPIESDLAIQLGVHRSTVREGIRALENAGLIRRVGAKRLMVSVPDGQAVAWATSRAMGLRKVSFVDLWEVQMELEPFCAELAAQRADDRTARALVDNVGALKANIHDDRNIIALDIEFHRLVAETTNNAALVLTREPISVMLFSATLDLYRKVPVARTRLVEAHARICDAIVARNPAEARQWMAKHIADFRRGYVVAKINVDAPIDIGAGPAARTTSRQPVPQPAAEQADPISVTVRKSRTGSVKRPTAAVRF